MKIQVKNNKNIQSNKSRNKENHLENKEETKRKNTISKVVEIDKYKYKIIREKNECFNIDEIKKLYTDYFEKYDYILGDYSYDKLRLKGFCDKTNEIFNNINDINKVDEYIENYCSYKANYFLLKKI